MPDEASGLFFVIENGSIPVPECGCQEGNALGAR